MQIPVPLVPTTQDELAQSLGRASAEGRPIEGIDLSRLQRVVEYTPEDLTVTVEAGLCLGELQARLAQRKQWLPIDPPFPERTTIWELLKFNLSGPRRYGWGTIREHLIGLKMALADGRIIRSGGKVVKNVAGYDLLKLFVGDQGSLGVALEATFKVQPLPESERFFQLPSQTLKNAEQALATLADSPLAPQVLDLFRAPDPACPAGGLCLVVGFAGTREDVEWSTSQASTLGITAPTSLGYDRRFWSEGDAGRVSVLPSRLVETLERLNPKTFVARAGNGVLYYRGGEPAPVPTTPPSHELAGLARRLKTSFDSKGILPAQPDQK